MRPKKLLLVVNVDWFFISHRLPVALAAMKQGYEVHLACGVTGREHYLKGLGIVIHPLPLSRSGLAFASEIKAIASIFTLIKRLKPDLVHAVTIKPVVYAGLASKILGVCGRITSISGLGFVFIDRSFKARILRFFVKGLYRFVLRGSSAVIFQNPTDRQLFVSSGIINSDQAHLIPGSGVELSAYPVAPLQLEPLVILLARLLKDKGVVEFVEASRSLAGAARMVLVGDIDLHNPNSVTKDQLDAWVEEGVVEHWGFTDEVAKTLAQARLVVLPSYREGLPKSLIEAAACGRAVITTDVPGCRDAIIPNKTGILIPPRDAGALVIAIDTLLADHARLESMGQAGRKWAEERFDITDVVASHLKIYGSQSLRCPTEELA